jgi:hypothetical protein
MPAPAHAGAEDDVKITALKLPPETLSPEMDAYFKKCDEKLGFVPNVLKAFAFDDGKHIPICFADRPQCCIRCRLECALFLVDFSVYRFCYSREKPCSTTTLRSMPLATQR